MNNPNIDLIVNFEEKIDKLVERYRIERKENSMLRGEISRLTQQLEQASDSYAGLEEQINKLKMAKAIEASSEDVHETKLRINQIVREIDKCIALLNR